MIDEINSLGPFEIARTNANLRLASRFIREYLDEPERYGPIPLGASVVLLPPDGQDAELTQANLRLAQRLKAEGREVILWTLSPA